MLHSHECEKAVCGRLILYAALVVGVGSVSVKQVCAAIGRWHGLGFLDHEGEAIVIYDELAVRPAGDLGVEDDVIVSLAATFELDPLRHWIAVAIKLMPIRARA